MPARVGDEYCLGRFDVETRPFTICELARGAGFECGNLECDGARVEQVIGVEKFYVVTARSSKTPVESRRLAEVVLVDDLHAVASSKVGEYPGRTIRRSIINHDNFDARIRLC